MTEKVPISNEGNGEIMNQKLTVAVLILFFTFFQIIYADTTYQINQNYCTSCGNCVSHCPEGAIYYDYLMGCYQIDQELCEGCGDCVSWCNHNAIYPTEAVDENNANFADLTVNCVPNPVKNSAKIYFDLPQISNSKISINIYNSSGQKIKSFQLLNSYESNFVEWNLKNLQGKAVSSGTYFYEIETNIGNVIKALTVIK